MFKLFVLESFVDPGGQIFCISRNEYSFIFRALLVSGSTSSISTEHFFDCWLGFPPCGVSDGTVDGPGVSVGLLGSNRGLFPERTSTDSIGVTLLSPVLSTSIVSVVMGS